MIFKYVLIVIGVVFIPLNISNAAQLSFEVVSQEKGTDSVTVIEVFLDPEGISINAIEGTIGLLGKGAEQLSTVVIETGESALNYWPQYPEYSLSEHVIRFTGGTTESFSEKRALFQMRIFAKQQDELILSWLGGSAYRGDGEGTEEAISSRSLTTVVTKSEPNQISASSIDTKPPQFDEIRVSQDEDVYGGKYFLSFHAVDDVSGVVGYDVVEGGETTKVDNGIYLLKDQERNTKTVIIAYDGAGNSTSVKAPTKYDWLSKVVLSGVGLLLAFAFLYWYKRRYRGGSLGLRK
jgi:hypothetical protein